MFVPVPSQYLEYIVVFCFFVFSHWRLEVIVRFVDIDGIVDRPSLFKLSIHKMSMKWNLMIIKSSSRSGIGNHR